MQDTQQITSTTDVQQEAIVRGPSKFELMLALFDHTMTNGRTVTFVVGNGAAMMHEASGRELGLTGATRVEVAINEVGRESGDGESWLFKGYVPGGAKSVEGYYSTRTNTGRLKRSTR
jgi:hypothetical protein